MPSDAIAVLGAGSWGTALAKLLADQGLNTTLWARESMVATGIETANENPLFLAGVTLPATLRATDDPSAAIAGANVVVNVVPTQYVRAVFSELSAALREVPVVVTASKGIEAQSLRTPHEILIELGAPPNRVVALSGPSFAREVAAGLPSAVVAAGSDSQTTRRVRDLFSTDRFRVYSSDDIVSAELGGALKNVVAIATGVSDGLGFGLNARAAIITRGLAEITRLGVARGGNPLTFAGLSGIGDLVLTCTGDLSRNRSVGLAIGQGQSLTEITAGMNEVAEGVHTCRSARSLAAELGIELPINEQVYQLLYEGKDPAQAMLDLTGRELRDEREEPGAGR